MPGPFEIFNALSDGLSDLAGAMPQPQMEAYSRSDGMEGLVAEIQGGGTSSPPHYTNRSDGMEDLVAEIQGGSTSSPPHYTNRSDGMEDLVAEIQGGGTSSPPHYTNRSEGMAGLNQMIQDQADLRAATERPSISLAPLGLDDLAAAPAVIQPVYTIKSRAPGSGM